MQRILQTKKIELNELPAVIKKVLDDRGIKEEEEIQEFFSSKPQLAYDPFLLADMRAGVDLLLKMIDENKQIVIYGDYDADGITSTSLLMKVIGCLTDRISFYIPSRTEEGYGLHKEAIDKIHEDGGEVIITVDCGSVSVEESKYAHELGIETIITDHHNVADKMAEGVVINPHRTDDSYPFKGLAGVGVAYKFALAISKERDIPKEILSEVLELVAIGTVADCMPLIDENRTIVKYGLRLMKLGCRNVGLRKLIEFSGLDYKKMKATNISFGIAPRINSAGRIGDAAVGVKMFLSKSEEEAAKYCSYLVNTNVERKSYQEEAYDECIEEAMEELKKTDFLVLKSDTDHEGILGIVAGRIKEELNRPVIILSEDGENYKGTGRSIEEVDMYNMLKKYDDLFLRFGGHKAACGFSIPKKSLGTFKDGIANDISEMKAKNENLFKNSYSADAFLKPDEIDLSLAEIADLFEPCGKDNEAIIFAIDNAEIKQWNYLKNDTKFAKFFLSVDGGDDVECILFHDAEKYKELYDNEEKLSVLANVSINEWHKNKRVQLVVQDIVPVERVTVNG